MTAALVAIFGKKGMADLDPTLATTVRAVLMAAFLVATSFALRKFEGFSLGSFGTKDWIYIIAAAVCGALSWLFYFIALKYGLASKVAAVDRTSLAFVIILSALFLGETIGWKAALGGLLMVGGAIIIAL